MLLIVEKANINQSEPYSSILHYLKYITISSPDLLLSEFAAKWIRKMNTVTRGVVMALVAAVLAASYKVAFKLAFGDAGPFEVAHFLGVSLKSPPFVSRNLAQTQTRTRTLTLSLPPAVAWGRLWNYLVGSGDLIDRRWSGRNTNI